MTIIPRHPNTFLWYGFLDWSWHQTSWDIWSLMSKLTCTGFRPWANITALTLTSSLAGFLHDFAFVLWRQQVKGTFAWEKSELLPVWRGGEEHQELNYYRTTSKLQPTNCFACTVLYLYRIVYLLPVASSWCKYLELCISVHNSQSASLLYNNTWIEVSCSNAQGIFCQYI